jgi:ribonuclease HI
LTRQPQHQPLKQPATSTPIDMINKSELHIKRHTTPPFLQQEHNTAKPTPWYQRQIKDLHNLTGTVNLLTDPEEFPTMFVDKANIDIALDGGHEKSSGISTYGWVAAVNKTLVAKGRGATEAHPILAESFRAESYGLSSALIFIHNMAKHFNISLAAHRITIYIDNMVLIQRMEGYRAHVSVPRWNLRSDQDITRFANKLMADIPANIVHVHSHQDDNKDWENLSFPAQLNTMADEQASHHREMMDRPAEDVTNLM